MKRVFLFLLMIFPFIVIGQTYTPVQGNKYYKGFSKFAKETVIEDTLHPSKGIVYPDGTIGTTGFESGDTVSLSSITTIPTIFYAAGDTSNQSAPLKIGNIFIDTSANKVYISKSANRGGWLILNSLFLVASTSVYKRKRNIKKVYLVLLLMLPLFLLAQTYKTNTINNNFTGYNKFTRPVKLNNTVLDSMTVTKSKWLYNYVTTNQTKWNSAAQEINDTITLSAAMTSLPFWQLPQLTTIEINTLAPTKAMFVFDKTLGVIKFYNGTVWKTLINN